MEFFLNVFSLLPLPSLVVSFSMAQMTSRLLGALASFLAMALRLFLSWLADPCPAAALSSCQAHMVSFRPAPQSLVSFALPWHRIQFLFLVICVRFVYLWRLFLSFGFDFLFFCFCLFFSSILISVLCVFFHFSISVVFFCGELCEVRSVLGVFLFCRLLVVFIFHWLYIYF